MLIEQYNQFWVFLYLTITTTYNYTLYYILKKNTNKQKIV